MEVLDILSIQPAIAKPVSPVQYPTMRVYLTNLGCKLNQAEMEDLARRVGRRWAPGRRLPGGGRPPRGQYLYGDPCRGPHLAQGRPIAAGRRGHGARTVLTGCYVSGSPDEAARLAGVDLVVSNQRKDDLLELVYERFPEWRPRTGAVVPVPYVPLEFGNSRALVKIEDGCNMSCSFCIIPTTRGRQRSRSGRAIIDEVNRLCEGGFREIVLTGVQISSYRRGDERLTSLVRRILAETEVDRLRLTSIAPWDFDPRLLDLVETGRVCRHFHLSLQSGCDRTLRRMRRPYDSRGFASLVSRIRRRIPDIAITTDVIVGFPGESETDFRESLELIQAMRFAKLHAFPFSPREGTAAATMKHPVPSKIQRERMGRILEVAARSEHAFRADHLGKTLPVLWERAKQGVWHGTSDNYLKVRSTSTTDLRLALTPTLIERLDDDQVRGRPLLAA